jgi:hypothetical protein
VISRSGQSAIVLVDKGWWTRIWVVDGVVDERAMDEEVRLRVIFLSSLFSISTFLISSVTSSY